MSLRPAAAPAAARAPRRATPARTRRLDDVLAAGTMPTGMLSALSQGGASATVPPDAQPSAPSAPQFPEVFDEQSEKVKRMVSALNNASLKDNRPHDFSRDGFHFKALLDEDQQVTGFDAWIDRSQTSSLSEWIKAVAGEKFTITYEGKAMPDILRGTFPDKWQITYADGSKDLLIVDFQFSTWHLAIVTSRAYILGAHMSAGLAGNIFDPLINSLIDVAKDPNNYLYPRLVAHIDANGVRTDNEENKTQDANQCKELGCLVLALAMWGFVISATLEVASIYKYERKRQRFHHQHDLWKTANATTLNQMRVLENQIRAIEIQLRQVGRATTQSERMAEYALRAEHRAFEREHRTLQSRLDPRPRRP